MATSSIDRQLNVKSITFSGTTDANGNIYTSKIDAQHHRLLNAIPTTADYGCVPILGGDLLKWNFHITTYNSWNVGSGHVVTVKVDYIDI